MIVGLQNKTDETNANAPSMLVNYSYNLILFSKPTIISSLISFMIRSHRYLKSKPKSETLLVTLKASIKRRINQGLPTSIGNQYNIHFLVYRACQERRHYIKGYISIRRPFENTMQKICRCGSGARTDGAREWFRRADLGCWRSGQLLRCYTLVIYH